MASRQPERFIPHVMDVFRIPFGAASGSSAGRDDDAGHRRRFGHAETEDEIDSVSRFGEYDGNRLLRPKRGTTNASVPNNYSHQARTLTERDIKHIERHLSMKKTIRKQLSRHLSQAFVESNDDSTAALDGKQNSANESRFPARGSSNLPPPALQQRSQARGLRETTPDGAGIGGRRAGGPLNSNYHFTVRQPRTAGTADANFLALLKEGNPDDSHPEDGDSGHCSPTADLDLVLSQWTSVGGRDDRPCAGDLRPGRDSSSSSEAPKKSSFWKKLTIRAKSKR